jgi:hypothetical protein
MKEDVQFEPNNTSTRSIVVFTRHTLTEPNWFKDSFFKDSFRHRAKFVIESVLIWSKEMHD